MDCLYVLVTLSQKSVCCLNSPCSLFPERSPFSVPAWTTRLLLSFLTSTAFFPPPLPQPPGACTAQTLKMGVGMSEFRCLLKRETCRLYVLLWDLLSFLLCKAEWTPARAGGVEEPTFSVKQSSATLRHMLLLVSTYVVLR